jgi:DNA-binding NarL/FixJ family response regulator
VVATIYDDDQHVFPALRAGAHGYVLKEQSREVLARLLTGIVSGEPPLSPSIARKMLRFFNPAPTPDDEAGLSPREEEVLRLIAKGYTLAAVGDLLKISRHTVAGYVKALYRKLNVTSRAEATLEAARRGIVNPGS